MSLKKIPTCNALVCSFRNLPTKTYENKKSARVFALFLFTLFLRLAPHGETKNGNQLLKATYKIFNFSY